MGLSLMKVRCTDLLAFEHQMPPLAMCATRTKSLLKASPVCSTREPIALRARRRLRSASQRRGSLRQRHAQDRTGANLCTMRAKIPIVAVWNDQIWSSARKLLRQSRNPQSTDIQKLNRIVAAEAAR